MIGSVPETVGSNRSDLGRGKPKRGPLEADARGAGRSAASTFAGSWTIRIAMQRPTGAREHHRLTSGFTISHPANCLDPSPAPRRSWAGGAWRCGTWQANRLEPGRRFTVQFLNACRAPSDGLSDGPDEPDSVSIGRFGTTVRSKVPPNPGAHVDLDRIDLAQHRGGPVPSRDFHE